MKTIFFVLICLILGTIICKSGSKEKMRKRPEKTLIKKPTVNANLSLDKFKEFIKEKTHVFVSVVNDDKENEKFNKILKRLKKAYEKSDLGFLSINTANKSAEELQAYNFHNTTSGYIYINGSRKHFSGQLTAPNLKTWIKELLSAKVRFAKSLDKVAAIDKHYFVYASASAIKNNKQYFDTLAKLISPLSVYSGLNKSELAKILKNKAVESPAFVYQEHDDSVQFVDLSKPIEKEAESILAGEFPEWLPCQASALKFLSDFKIPGLVYFATSNDDPNWDIVKQAAHPYKEYFMTIKVTPDMKNRCAQFLRDFLGVKKTSELRILNMSTQVKRYNFIGSFDEEHLDYFLSNYISGNLKSYKLNQRVRPGQKFKGVDVANYKMFKKALKDTSRTFLFYVYDKSVTSLKSDLKAMAAVRANFSKASDFKIFSIDHDKNDLDGFYNNALPFVFAVVRKGKLVTYKEQRISSKSLIEFIKVTIPYLNPKNMDISTDL